MERRREIDQHWTWMTSAYQDATAKVGKMQLQLRTIAEMAEANGIWEIAKIARRAMTS